MRKILGSEKQDNSLGGKVSQGAILVTISYAFEKLTRIVSIIVLARLLDPGEFGLVAMAMIVINALTIVNDFGLGAAIIYKKERVHLVADTALVLTFFFGLGSAVLAFFVAPLAVGYFKNDGVRTILQVLSLLVAIRAFEGIPGALLQKELNFSRKIIPEVARSFSYAILAMSTAFLGFGAWSLVIGELGSNIISLVLMWVLAGWRPYFRFDFEVAREVLGYGKHIVLTSVFLFAAMNIDYMMIGRVLGTTALGLYTIAFKIATYPADTLRLVSSVIFPMFSKLEFEKEKLGRAYLRALNYVTFLVVPAGLIIMFMAPVLIEVVLGEKWVEAAPVTQALVWFGLSWIIVGNTSELFRATGRPDLHMRLEMVKFLTLAPLLYFLTPLGILAVGLAQSILMAALVPVYLGLVIRILGLKTGELWGVLNPTFASCAVMIVCLGIVHGVFSIGDVKLSSSLTLGGYVGVSVISYSAAVMVFNKKTAIGIIEVLDRGLRAKLLSR